MYAYIDESGDTGYTKKSTRYFILTAVIVDNPFILRRITKSVHKTKIDKEKANMLHARDENRKTKDILTEKMKDAGIQCVVFVLDKKKVYIKDPYMYLLKEVSKYFSEFYHVIITLAKRDTRRSYNQNIFNLFISDNLKLLFSDPLLEKSLQIADFYSWTVFSHLEHDHSEYFIRLKENITLRQSKAPEKRVDHQGGPSSRV